jgi:predicted enzyme related to lactoylglutathione lyase
MANQVMHFEVLGKDGKKLREFYSALFGWKIDADNPMQYGLVAADPPGIGGGIGQSQLGQPMVTFYVAVEDLQKALDRAESLGGKTLMPPMQVPDGPKIAMFRDPEGNAIGLVLGVM